MKSSLVWVNYNLRLLNYIEAIFENKSKMVHFIQSDAFLRLLITIVLELVPVHLWVTIYLNQGESSIIRLIYRQQVIFTICDCNVLKWTINLDSIQMFEVTDLVDLYIQIFNDDVYFIHIWSNTVNFRIFKIYCFYLFEVFCWVDSKYTVQKFD